MSQNILIIGATSSIARATAMEFAARGHNLFLLSRDQEELARLATDLMIRYPVQVKYLAFDMEDIAQHQQTWQKVLAQMPQIDGVLLAAGYLGNQKPAAVPADTLPMGDSKGGERYSPPLVQAKALLSRSSKAGSHSRCFSAGMAGRPQNLSEQEKIIRINFTGAVSILSYCTDYFIQQKHGFIIAIGSVAGERGRATNYAYGAAKGALALYLQGLRNYLNPFNIHILTIKLGFVDTAMIYGRSGLFLVADPNAIGKKIVRSLDKRREVIYLPGFWRYLMFVVKLIPEKIFKNLKL